jgi:hypothetical protein
LLILLPPFRAAEQPKGREGIGIRAVSRTECVFAVNQETRSFGEPVTIPATDRFRDQDEIEGNISGYLNFLERMRTPEREIKISFELLGSSGEHKVRVMNAIRTRDLASRLLRSTISLSETMKA